MSFDCEGTHVRQLDCHGTPRSDTEYGTLTGTGIPWAQLLRDNPDAVRGAVSPPAAVQPQAARSNV